MPNHTIQEEVISVQSLRLQNDAVTQPPAEPIYFEIYPNPAHGKATLHSEGLSHPHVTITNILGQVVRDEAVANDWLWDGMSSAGNSEPAGTYYVIASGITSNWQHVQKVLPLILMR
jgi:hypothetical protein